MQMKRVGVKDSFFDWCKRREKKMNSQRESPNKRVAHENGTPGDNKKRVRRGGARKKSANSFKNPSEQKSPSENNQHQKQKQRPNPPPAPAQAQKHTKPQKQHQPKESNGQKKFVAPDTNGPATMHHLSDVKFISLDISENSKRALTQDLKYEFLTHIQNETFSHVLQGEDVLAKAKTGNGKTVAFLLPLVERFLNSFKSHVDRIPILILSPTRELALQITAEARKLTKYHHLHTACFVGGTSINRDIRTISSKDLPIDLLIATPGRLQDHLEKDSGNITSKLGACEILVLDEADRLLDMGFRPVILKIIEYLPKKRQTLLFSATLPASTQELTKIALREDYRFVDTIDEDDHQTNKQTEQHFVLCKMEEIIPATETLLLEHLKRPEYKVMVFFPTARTAGYMATLFLKAGFNVLEMHSRKSQSHRTKTAEIFRKSNKVIMFSSDVSARGVDYPDISLVLQVGLTDRDQYIHRLGRTARAGMEGQGILLLAEFEKPLLKELSDLPIQEMSLPISLNGSKTAKVLLATSRNQELMRVAEMSYQAWLGFYNTHLKRLGLDKVHLVQMAAEYSKSIGLIEVPRIQKKTLKKMNLFGVPGIRVDHS